MKSRKLSALLAVTLLWATTPAAAQVGPNPTPEAPPPAPAQPPAQTELGSTGGGIFGSDLTFMLVAILGASLLTFLATQVGGDDDEPVSP